MGQMPKKNLYLQMHNDSIMTCRGVEQLQAKASGRVSIWDVAEGD